MSGEIPCGVSMPTGPAKEWTYDEKSSQVKTYRDRAGRDISYALDTRGNVVTKTQYERRYDDTPDRKTVRAYTLRPASIDQLPGGLVVSETVAAGTVDAVTNVTEYYASGAHVGLPAMVRYAVASSGAAAATTRYRYDAHSGVWSRRWTLRDAAPSTYTMGSTGCTSGSIRRREPGNMVNRSPRSAMMRWGT